MLPKSKNRTLKNTSLAYEEKIVRRVSTVFLLSIKSAASVLRIFH
jgi:hypothetical protein